MKTKTSCSGMNISCRRFLCLGNRDEATISCYCRYVETLNEQAKEGKIRYIGLSNWSVSRMIQAEQYAKAHHLLSFVGDQVLWNAAVLVDRPYHSENCEWMDDERFSYHRQNGIAAFAYQPQAFGFFHRMLAGALDSMDPYFRSFYRERETIARLERMKRFMGESGYSLT